MSNDIVQSGSKQMMELDPEIISNLVLNGDLSKLNPSQKVQYYSAMCNRIGLDPATQPFKLMKLQGKEVMYCDRSGAAQLNKVHKISHQRTSTETVNDVFIVYMKAIMADGRFTESSGAVSIRGLSGDSLANAIMKAETKAKRRSTLDIVGLGILDETELETIPAVRVVPVIQKTAPLPTEEKGKDITKEALEAAAAEAKARIQAQEAEEQTNKPAVEPEPVKEGLAPVPGQKVLKGLLAAYYPPKGKGPHSFFIEGEYAKTFDVDLAETLIKHKEMDDEVELICAIETKGQFTNNMIQEIAVSK